MRTYEDIYDTTASLMNTGEINGIYYNNSLLEAEGFNDTPTTGKQLIDLNAAFLFQQGEGQKYIECFVHEPDGDSQSVMASYYDILGKCRVSQATVDRIPEHIQSNWRGMQEQVSPTPLFAYTAQMVKRFDAPIGVITQHTVRESDTASAGDRVLNLYYPYFIGPRMALAGMKQVIKNRDALQSIIFRENGGAI